MKKTMQWVIVVGILMVTFLLPAFLYKVSDLRNSTNSRQIKNNTNLSSIKIEDEDFNDLRFSSIPPSIAVSGGEFMYQVNLQNFTDSNASIAIVSKPEWLNWNEESLLLSGKVPNNSSPFTVRLSANIEGGLVVEQFFTVQIEDDSASDPAVKGAKDSAWKDPFHPVDVETNMALLDTNSDASVLGASVSSSEIEEESSRWVIAGGITVSALVVYAIWLFVTSEKNQFLRGTGRLIVERGKKK